MYTLKKPKGYRYYSCGLAGLGNRLGSAIFTGLGIWFIVYGLVDIGQNIISRSWIGVSETVSLSLATMLSAVMLAAIPMCLSLTIAHRFCDIGVGAEGLAVQVYYIFWKQIPWSDVVAVRPPMFPSIQIHDKALVVVRKLTIWHQAISSSYLGSFAPSIPITGYHHDYEELIQAVKGHLDDRGDHR